MGIELNTAPGFFLLRPSKGVQPMGSRWPDGAVVELGQDRHALIYDDGTYKVRKSAVLDDLVRAAQQEMVCGNRKSITVVKANGRFDDSAVYETVFKLTNGDTSKKDDDDPVSGLVGNFDVKVASDGSTKDVTITGFASTPKLDRDFDIVLPEAFEDTLKEFSKNPVLMWNHGFDPNFGFAPIGKIDEIEVRDNKGLWVKATVTDEQVKVWLRKGLLNMFSVQFRTIDREFREAEFDEQGMMTLPPVRIVKKADLLEVTIATVPANNGARIETIKSAKLQDGSCDLGGCDVEAPMCVCDIPKGVIEYRQFKTADPGDCHEQALHVIRKQFGDAAARLCFTFEDGEDLFLQHSAVVDGELKTVPELVRLSMAQIVARQQDMTDEQRHMAWSTIGKRWKECFSDDPIPLIDKWPSPGAFAKTWLGDDFEGKPAHVRMSKEQFGTTKVARAWLDAHGFGGFKDVQESPEHLVFKNFACRESDLAEDSSRKTGIQEGIEMMRLPESPKSAGEDIDMKPQEVADLVAKTVSDELDKRDRKTGDDTGDTGDKKEETTTDDTSANKDSDEIGDDEVVSVDVGDLAIVEAASRGSDEDLQFLAGVSDEAYQRAMDNVAGAASLVEQ